MFQNQTFGSVHFTSSYQIKYLLLQILNYIMSIFWLVSNIYYMRHDLYFNINLYLY